MSRKQLQRALHGWVEEAERIDRAVYGAVAGTPTPLLDGIMRRVSTAADYSRLSVASAGVLAIVGGPTGRRAARSGLASVAATSALVNLVLKYVRRRRRPNLSLEAVSEARQIPMPSSPSFPSGHAASAVAFASGAGRVLTIASVPLHAMAALVAYSRVHTGVHYPGDILAGAVTGAVIADLTTGAIGRWSSPAAATVARGS